MASATASKEYKLAIKIAGAVSSSFDSAIGEAGQKISNLGSIAQAAAATAAAAWGALKLGEFISGAIDSYQGFEQSMADTAATAGATAEEYAAMRQAALAMGRATTKTASECADALGYMSLAGWDVNTSIASLEPVLRLSEATGMDLARCSDLVTDSMSALGVETKDLAQYLDIAATANNKSNQTAEMLMEAYIGVGGTLKNLNIPIQQSAAALGVLANRGIKGSEAGSALNAVLVNLTTGTGQAGTMMKKLGISAFDSNGKFIGLQETIQKVYEATKDMTEAERNAALAAIGGKQHTDALNALMSGLTTTTAEGVSEWNALADALYNSEGAMANMATAVTNTWEGANARLESAIDDLKINLVSTFAPYATEAINSVAAAIPNITAAIIPAAQGFVDYAIPKITAFKDRAVQIFNDIRPTLESIGTTAQGAFSFLADTAGTAMQKVGEVISSHSGLFTKLGQIAQNVGGIIADIGKRLKPVISYAATTALPQIADAVLTVVDKLADLALMISENKALVIALVSAFAAFKGITAISELGNKISNVSSLLSQFQSVTSSSSLAAAIAEGKLSKLTAVFGTLTGQIKLTDVATEAAKAKLSTFTSGFKSIGNVAKTAFTSLKSGITSIGTTLAGVGSKIMGFIAANPAVLIIAAIAAVIAIVVTLYNKCEWFRQKVDAILEAVKGYLAVFGEKAKGVFQNIWAVVQSVWAQVQPYLEAAWQSIIAAVSAVVSFFQTDVFPGIKAVLTSVCGVFTAAWELIKAVWSQVQPYFLAIWEAIKTVFSVAAAVLGGFFKAAWNGIQLVWAAVSPWFAAIWEAIKAIFSVAGAVLGGFFTTAWEAVKAVWNTATAYFRAVFDTIAGIFSVFSSLLSGDFSGAWETIKGIAGTWASFFGTVWHGIKAIFGAVGSWFGGIFTAAFDGIKNTAAAGLNAIRSSIAAFWSKLDELTGGAITRIGEFFSGLWDGIKSLWNGAAAWFQNNVTSPITGFFGAASQAVKGFFTDLWANVQALWRGAAAWFQNTVITPIVNFFSPIIETVGGIFRGLWIIIQAVWAVAADWFSSSVITPIVNFFSPIVATVGGFFSSLWSGIQGVWATVSGWFDTTVIQPMVGFFSAIPGTVGGFFASLWANIQGVWATVSGWFDTTVIQPMVGFFSAIPGTVGGFFTSLWANIQAIWQTVAGWFDTTVIQPLVSFFSGIVESIGGFFSTLWQNIVSVWQAAGSWFQDNVATPINNAFQAVGDFVKGVFNGLIGVVEGMINSVIGGINKFVGGFSGVVEKAAGVIGIEWEGIPDIPTVSLPRMAEGGIVTAPTILEAGEAGDEAIIPLPELWGNMQDMIAATMNGATDGIAALADRLDAENKGERDNIPISDLLSKLDSLGNGDAPNGDGTPSMQIIYSPTNHYHFEGDAPSKEEIAGAESMSQDEFNRRMDQWLKDRQRTNFRG